MSAPWQWDNDYDNLEQVRPFLDSFKRRLADLTARGEYRYNDSFLGYIPGIDHLPKDGSGSQETVIYLLQKLERDDEYARKYAALLSDGFTVLSPGECPTARKFDVVISAYRDHARFSRYEQARVVDYRGTQTVLPKGKRTHGHRVEGEALVR